MGVRLCLKFIEGFYGALLIITIHVAYSSWESRMPRTLRGRLVAFILEMKRERLMKDNP